MRWLDQTRGTTRLLECDVVLPTRDWLDDSYDGSDEAILKVVYDVAEWLGVAPTDVTIRFANSHGCGPASCGSGTCSPHASQDAPQLNEVLLTPNDVSNLGELVAAVGFNLMRIELSDRGQLSTLAKDHDLVIDLATIHAGLGIFAANCETREKQVQTQSRLSNPTRLSESACGYALALFATKRGEAKPIWRNYLRPNVRQPLQQSLRHIRKSRENTYGAGDDAEFTATSAGSSNSNPKNTTILAADLRSASSSRRMQAMKEMESTSVVDPMLVEPLIALLSDRDDSLTSTAAHVLSTFGSLAENAIDALLNLLHDKRPTRNEHALKAIGKLKLSPERCIPAICSLLESPDSKVRWQAHVALAAYGDDARGEIPKLKKRLTTSRDDLVVGPAFAVGNIASADEAPVNELCEIVKNGEGVSRIAAVTALGNIGSKSQQSIDALHSAAADHDHEVRFAALNALRTSQDVLPGAELVLRQAMRHADPETRQRAAWAAFKVEALADEALEVLAKSLCPPLSEPSEKSFLHFDPETYRVAQSILRDVGENQIERLCNLLTSDDRQSRRFATWALTQCPDTNDATRKMLRAHVGDSDVVTSLFARFALCNCGESTASVVDGLLPLLNSAPLPPPVFSVCATGNSADGAVLEFAQRATNTDQLLAATIHLAIREIGSDTISALLRHLPAGTSSRSQHILCILAALDLQSEFLGQEGVRIPLEGDLDHRRALDSLDEVQESLRQSLRAYHLAVVDTPAATALTAPTSQGQLAESVWLLSFTLAQAQCDTQLPVIF